MRLAVALLSIALVVASKCRRGRRRPSWHLTATVAESCSCTIVVPVQLRRRAEPHAVRRQPADLDRVGTLRATSISPASRSWSRSTCAPGRRSTSATRSASGRRRRSRRCCRSRSPASTAACCRSPRRRSRWRSPRAASGSPAPSRRSTWKS